MARRSKARRTREREQHHKALAHEVRIDILTYFIDHSIGSPSAIAKETGWPVQAIDRHMKQLVRYEAAELVDIRPSPNGPPEHVYRATLRPLVNDEEVAAMSLPARHGFAGQCIDAIFDDVADAADADLFAKRADWVLARTPLLLDADGHKELRDLHKRVIKESLQIEARSNARRAESGEEAQRVSTCQLCFVLP